jgi:hypothetical protein
MDFAKLVTDYLNQRTEGDPSFIVSEESIAFVDLMRADDMDRRASSVEPSTSASARGEPSNEDVAGESRHDSVSESHTDASPSTQEESPQIITTPASPFTDVALGGNQDAGVISDIQEPDVSPLVLSAFTEDGQSPEPSSAFSESQPSFEPSEVFTEDSDQANPIVAIQDDSDVATEPKSPSSDNYQQEFSPYNLELIPEDSENTEPSSAFSESSPPSEPSSVFSESLPPSEPSSVFTEDGIPAAANSALRDEGVTVREYVTSKSETVILEPPSMPDFESLLQSFDRDYHPPDPPAGDTDMIPEEEDPEPSEPLQSTTEFCESMMSEILSTHLAYDRRGA